ncbi:MAG: hypothetical protein NTY37_13375 [Methanothrix sp.]|nr:hypothetical protein [Methanothrix sp.]
MVPYQDLLIKNGLPEKLEGEHVRHRTKGARLPLPHLRELESVRRTMEKRDLQRIYV